MSKNHSHGIQNEKFLTLREINDFEKRTRASDELGLFNNVVEDEDKFYENLINSIENCTTFIDCDPANEFLEKSYFPELIEYFSRWLIVTTSKEEKIPSVTTKITDTFVTWLNALHSSWMGNHSSIYEKEYLAKKESIQKIWTQFVIKCARLGDRLDEITLIGETMKFDQAWDKLK